MATGTCVVKYYIITAVLSLVTPSVKSIVVLKAAKTDTDNITDSSCSFALHQVPSVSILPLTFNYEGNFPRAWVDKSEEFLAVYPEPQKIDVQEDVQDTITFKSKLSDSAKEAQEFDLDKKHTVNQQIGTGSGKRSEQFNFVQTTAATLQLTTTSPKLVRQLYNHSLPASIKPSTGNAVNSVHVSIPKPKPEREILPKGHSSSSEHPRKRLSDLINQVRLLKPALSFGTTDFYSSDTGYSETRQSTTQTLNHVPIPASERRHYRSPTFDHIPETWLSTTQSFDYWVTSTSDTMQSSFQTLAHESSPSSEPVFSTPTAETEQSMSQTIDIVSAFTFETEEFEHSGFGNVPTAISSTTEFIYQTLDHGPTSETLKSKSKTFSRGPIANSMAIPNQLSSEAVLQNSDSHKSLPTQTQEPSVSLLSSLVLNSVTKVKSQAEEDTDTILYDITYFGMAETPLNFSNSTYIDDVDNPTPFNSSEELNDEDIDLISGNTQLIDNPKFQPYWAFSEPPSSIEEAMESTSTTEDPYLPDLSIQTDDRVDGSFSDGEHLSGYQLANIGKSEPMDLASLEKELHTVLASRLPVAVDADLLNLWRAPFVQRLQHVNHEMVDEILQTDIEIPPKWSECPLEYHELARASLQRMLGLLLLSLPQSLKEVEDAIWDQELENYFFRHQEKNILDVSICRDCYVQDPFGKCREIFLCKNGVAAGPGPRLTPQQMAMLLMKAKKQ